MSQCRSLDPACAKDLLEEIMPIGDGQPPERVLAWVDQRGNFRRVRADYANGWTLTVFFTKPKGGKVSVSSCKASMRMAAKPVRGRAAA